MQNRPNTLIYFVTSAVVIYACSHGSPVLALTPTLVPDDITASESANEEQPVQETIEGLRPIVTSHEAGAEEYELPYPGILPNHPLYPLKLVRDRLLDFLIRDPVKRINFYLLMADKRLNMGVYLTDEKEYVLAEETVSKGEKYLVRAIDALYETTEQGREIPSDMVLRISRSSRKHKLVITDVMMKSPENISTGYVTSLETAAENIKRIEEFSK